MKKENNLTMFCLSMNPKHYNLIRGFGYVPVGLGENIFDDKWLQDKAGTNISNKNKFYGEYTFHYWIWKNYIDKIKTNWVGFCQYRKFFLKDNLNFDYSNYNQLDNCVVKDIDTEDKDFECILGDQFSVQNYKLSKIIKHHFKKFIQNPGLIFFKKKRNLRVHFELFHGKKNLDVAIDLLDEEDRGDFNYFMNNQTSFNPHNMFICKTENLKRYYQVIFPWLQRCENHFGFDLEGYGLKRIYGFLAERFLSYWFLKNYKVKELPITFKNLSDFL